MIFLFEISVTWFWALMCCSGLLGLILGAYMVKRLLENDKSGVDIGKSKDRSVTTVIFLQDSEDNDTRRRWGIGESRIIPLHNTDKWTEEERRIWVEGYNDLF